MLEQHLVVLLMKLVVAGSLAAILGRSAAFLRVLMREERTVPQRLQMALLFAVIFGAGVAFRVLTGNSYQSLDLGLEGALLAGVLGGYFTGLVAGVLISLPSMFNQELLSMLLLAGVGVLGGLVRDLAPSTSDIWSFTPYFDRSVYRLFRRRSDKRVTLFHLFLFLVILFAEFLRWMLDRILEDRLLNTAYSNWRDADWLVTGTIYATTVFTFTIPLKIWNSIRQERLLEAQRRLLTESRLRALTSQINPHFLFNTLNTVSSLTRTNPDEARTVIRKLSNILRGLMRKQENLSPLREELALINDYLSIEMVRFGAKLKFVNQLAPDTLDRLVPSMLLQPIIENSIKHGLAPKVGGGVITLRSRFDGQRLHLEVEDDGVGVPDEKLERMFDSGIGVSNVKERLEVLFGQDFRMDVDSRPGEGTRTHIQFPDLAGRR
jgi:two-component system, LytTR family, sensor kinase